MRGQVFVRLLSTGLAVGTAAAVLHPVAAAAQPEPAPAVVNPRALQQYDPLERFNRAMFRVDRGINRLVAGKATIGSPGFVSPRVKNGVYNFFNNLGEPATAANDVLQMKWRRAGVATARFAANSTIGMLGARDVASGWGLKRHREDFGQTLARWGAPAGPFIYLPLMGPSTVRDKLAGRVDSYVSPMGYVEMDELPSRVVDYTQSAVQPKTVSIRARARVARESGETGDEYAYLRDLYYAQRAAEIEDTPQAERYIAPSMAPPPPMAATANDDEASLGAGAKLAGDPAAARAAAIAREDAGAWTEDGPTAD